MLGRRDPTRFAFLCKHAGCKYHLTFSKNIITDKVSVWPSRNIGRKMRTDFKNLYFFTRCQRYSDDENKHKHYD